MRHAAGRVKSGMHQCSEESTALIEARMASEPRHESDAKHPTAADVDLRHFLRICRTCPRYDRLPPPGESTRGLLLVDAIRTLAETWPVAEKFTILGVHCLSGCPTPCNVALAARGKPGLRFHKLDPSDAALVVELATLYYDAPNGEPQLPPMLLDRLAAVIPAFDLPGRP